MICSSGQILKVSTNPTLIATQIPGYSQVSVINTKTYPYSASNPSPNIIPIDEDSTTEDDRIYEYGDVIPVSITMADGNISTTTLGKVWSLRISIPNAFNV